MCRVSAATIAKHSQSTLATCMWTVVTTLTGKGGGNEPFFHLAMP